MKNENEFEKIIIARYGEIHLKGGNRSMFINALMRNLMRAVGERCKVEIKNGRIVFSKYEPCNETLIIKKVAQTFGLVSLSPAIIVPHDKILSHLETIEIGAKSFRVNVNRADKTFPHTSMEFPKICGDVILKCNPYARVDLHKPDVTVDVDIREQNRAYVFDNVIKGLGGLPVGVSGKCLVLLSGGIDSPVAAYLAAKRGLSIECVHFASPPYTSDLALDKVKRLIGRLEIFCGKINYTNVSFTELLTEIKDKCNEQYIITILRRFMIRLAKIVANKSGCDCIITGENLAQVASQTIQGITTNNVCAGDMPILRPLIMYDKVEIIELAKQIGTYEISIEPHQDCCTVFVPSSPIIAPTIEQCEAEEDKLDMDNLFEETFYNVIPFPEE